jgi:hypothetical protein
VDGSTKDHLLIRHLERIPAGSSYAAVAKRIGAVTEQVYWRREKPPDLFVDATGLGQPVLDLVERETGHGWILSVYMNHGDRRDQEPGEVKLGKAWLVARLQTLLQTGQLHLPRTAEAEQLAEDLLEFEIRVSEEVSDRPRAFPVGRHDDLVTALGLAVQEDPPRWSLTSIQYK